MICYGGVMAQVTTVEVHSELLDTTSACVAATLCGCDHTCTNEADDGVEVDSVGSGDPISVATDAASKEDETPECELVSFTSSKDEETTVRPPCEDDYENIKLISSGAYGAVYLVRHKASNERMALKKINKHNLLLRNQVEQVFAERDIMSFTDNPFVVSMLCSFETKRHLCMVMEYVEGGDCATLLKCMGPLPVDLARFYFAETVLAVEYLHNYGIVHRDLKPDNLLITGMGHIKLTDFGLSKIGLMNLATNLCEGYLDKEAKQFNDKQVFGTPEYIAPEVILRQGYGKPVDWWALGIVLYEFLIGCVPFFGETPEELFAHVINDDIEWPVDEDWPLPEEAKLLISKLLQRNPQDRLGTGSTRQVKEDSFFDGVNWDALLRQKAEFVPELENEDDTSYFDTRTDRYNHELDDSEEQDDTDDSSMFSSFSSCSPRYHKVYSRIEKELAQERLLKSSSTSSIVDEESSSGCKSCSPTENTSILRRRSLNEGRCLSKDGSKEFQSKDHEHHLSSLSESCDSSNSVVGEPCERANTSSTSELSQGEGEEISPQIQRRKKPLNALNSSLPRFSISFDDRDSKNTSCPSIRESSAMTADSLQRLQSLPSTPRIPIPNNANSTSPPTKYQQRCRAVIKSVSASGLSLIIPAGEELVTRNLAPIHIASPGNSSTSSRDTSPNRDLNSLTMQLEPPIIIRKGARGFGFTLKAIRVYYGDTDVYTVHHLVMAVEQNSPAFEAGLRPGDLITHINGEPVQGLLHPQVLQLVLSGRDKINIRTTALENTTIKTGGRKRNPVTSKMIRRPAVNRRRKGPPVKRTESDKKRRSLLRRLSSRRASAEIQQLMTSSWGLPSPVALTPSRSYQSLSRSHQNSSSPSNCPSPLSTNSVKEASGSVSPLVASTPLPLNSSGNLLTAAIASSKSGRLPRPCNSTRTLLQCSPSDSSPGNSSQSSSPGSSVPNSPANLAHSPHFNRPSTLHGLKHKLVQTFRSPRRKSLGHIPLSPLARTPSPSVLPLATATSPSSAGTKVEWRSPSSLTCPPAHHQLGSSQTTQAYALQKSSSATTAMAGLSLTGTKTCSSLATTAVRKSISRPKSAEPGSPLLQTENSADRYFDNKGARPKSPAIRKRESLGCISSPLAVTCSPPSLSKVAVTNCFTQSAARSAASSHSDETYHSRGTSNSIDGNWSSSSSDCSIKDNLSQAKKTASLLKEVDKTAKADSASASYKTTVSIILSSTIQKARGGDTSPSDGQSAKAVKKAEKAAQKEKEKSGSKPCSPVSIRKSLFKSSSEKRSKSTTRLPEPSSSSSKGVKGSK